MALAGRHLCAHLGLVQVGAPQTAPRTASESGGSWCSRWDSLPPSRCTGSWCAAAARRRPRSGPASRRRKESPAPRVACPLTGGQLAVLAQCGLQALPDFGRLPGLQADLLRPLARGEDLGLEVQPLVRQGAERVRRFQVDEVLRSLHGAQLRLGGRAPAVRLRAQVLNFVQGPPANAETRAHRRAECWPPAGSSCRWPSLPQP